MTLLQCTYEEQDKVGGVSNGAHGAHAAKVNADQGAALQPVLK